MSELMRELIECGVAPTQARLFAQPLAEVMQRFAIDTAPRRAAFLAQCIHESAGFARLEEGLWYRTPAQITSAFARLRKLSSVELQALCRNPHGLADAAYGNLNGNRGSTTGDGWAYRGSGILQITGLANFQLAEMASGRPYVSQPELVRTNPGDAALTAALYWHRNGCNAIADAGDFDGLSKLINLGSRTSDAIPNGNRERRELYRRALRALGAGVVS